MLGTGLLTVALGLLAYDLAGAAAGAVLGAAYAIKMVAYVGIAPLAGAFADRIAIPSANVFPLPDHVPLEMGSIFDPFGNATHTALEFDLALETGEQIAVGERELAGEAEEALRLLAKDSGEKAGAYIHSARFAISGSGSGQSLFDAMEVLGRERVVARLRALGGFTPRAPRRRA